MQHENDPDQWTCAHCTVDNPGSEGFCHKCGRRWREPEIASKTQRTYSKLMPSVTEEEASEFAQLMQTEPADMPQDELVAAFRKLQDYSQAVLDRASALHRLNRYTREYAQSLRGSLTTEEDVNDTLQRVLDLTIQQQPDGRDESDQED